MDAGRIGADRAHRALLVETDALDLRPQGPDDLTPANGMLLDRLPPQHLSGGPQREATANAARPREAQSLHDGPRQHQAGPLVRQQASGALVDPRGDASPL